MRPSAWADKYFFQSAESGAEAGKWHTRHYQIAILDSFIEPRVEVIVWLKSSRVGYTKCINVLQAYVMHWMPASMLTVQPSLDDARGYSKDEIDTMIRDVPVLRDIVHTATGRRDKKDTLLKKTYAGGVLDLIGANAPGGFRRHTKKYVFFDETDGYPKVAGDEGDQIVLGMRRNQDFVDRKTVIGSSPTVADESKIEREHKASSKGYYVLTCPHCQGEHVRTFFERPSGIECGTRVLPCSWLKFSTDNPSNAAWVCPECAALIDHSHHYEMIESGYWYGEDWTWRDGKFEFSETFSGRIGFWLWAGYGDSPNTTPAHLAREFMEKKGSPDTYQTYVNTVLGELWKVVGEAPPFEAVGQLRMPYGAGEVPETALGITLGVDVQKNRLVCSVRAWGRGLSSWLIEAVELFGDPDLSDVWAQLDSLRGELFGARKMPISLTLIDSGYKTARVYEYAGKRPRVRATKGENRLDQLFVSTAIEVDVAGRRRKTGELLWRVNTDYFKSWIHGRLVDWPHDMPGAWLLHKDTTDDYCKQIVAESVIVHPSKGKSWINHGGDNHYLDCEVLNVVAAHMLQIHRYTDASAAGPRNTAKHVGGARRNG